MGWRRKQIREREKILEKNLKDWKDISPVMSRELISDKDSAGNYYTLGRYNKAEARPIRKIFNCINDMENIFKRIYNLEKNERLKRVYTKLVKTQEGLKRIRDNVNLVMEMNLERSTEESQVRRFSELSSARGRFSQHLSEQEEVHCVDDD